MPDLGEFGLVRETDELAHNYSAGTRVRPGAVRAGRWDSPFAPSKRTPPLKDDLKIAKRVSLKVLMARKKSQL